VIVATKRETFSDMGSKAVVQLDSCLGEYSDLTSIANVIPTSVLLYVLVYCGITIQRTVEHDGHSWFHYVVRVVIPSRISPTVTSTDTFL
jgi:hypothetical protein